MAFEIEHVFFGKLRPEYKAQMPQLASSIIRQEQWMIVSEHSDTRSGPYGQVRARFESILKSPNRRPDTYALAIKVSDSKSSVVKGVEEYEYPIDQKTFDAMRRISPFGQIKTRYVIPVGDHLVEIDTFETNAVGYEDWVKIDIEVSNSREPIPDVTGMISNIINAKDRTEDQAVFVAYLYNNVWGLFNDDNLEPLVSNKTDSFLDNEKKVRSIKLTSESIIHRW